MSRTRRTLLALATLAAAGLVAGDLGAGGAEVGDPCARYTISAEELGGREEALATDLIVSCDDNGSIRPCAVAAPDEDGDRAVTCEQAD